MFPGAAQFFYQARVEQQQRSRSSSSNRLKSMTEARHSLTAVSSIPPTIPPRTREKPSLHPLQKSVAKSSNPNVLSKLGWTGSLRVHVEQPVIFLHPPEFSNENLGGLEAPPSTQDSILRGNVILDLPRNWNVKMIRVVFQGDLPWEEGRTIDKDVEIKLEGDDQQLEKGKHIFEFTFIIPATSAPLERCRYGSISHHVKATAYSSSPLMPSLEDSCPVHLVVNPMRFFRDGSEDLGPVGLTLHTSGFQEEVGPWSLQLDSPHLTPSGLLAFKLELHEAPGSGLIIQAVALNILQSFTLLSRKDLSVISRPPAQTVPLFRLDHRDRSTSLGGVGSGGFPARQRSEGGVGVRPPSLSLSRLRQESQTPSISEGESSLREPVPLQEPATGFEQPELRPPPAVARPFPTLVSRRLSSNSTSSNSTTRPSTSASTDGSSFTNLSISGSRGQDRRQLPPSIPDPFPYPASTLKPLIPPKPPPSPPDQSGPQDYLSKMGPLSSFSLRHLVRLPDDDTLRPSTQESTETNIRVNHEIAVEVVYRRIANESEVKPKLRVFALQKNINLTSCCCRLESVLLPSYECSPLPPSSPREQKGAAACLCDLLFGTLKQEYSHLMSEGESGRSLGDEEGPSWKKTGPP